MEFEDIQKIKEELISFEKECCDRYANKEILSPMHLSGGNEEQLISIFKDIKPEDWVFTNYRSHYHALLKGIPRDWLMKEVIANRSMHIMSKEYNFVTTAIVGSTLSQAVGVALAIKLKGENKHVWAFCGDMCAEMGIFEECTKFAKRRNLPITFIVEDNGLSTDTPTQISWGEYDRGPNVLRYKYTRVWPHYGTGERIKF